MSPPTLAGVYESALRRYADRPAVQFRDRTVSYGELRERSAAFGAAMADAYESETRVALLTSNRPAYAVADLGLARAGLARVPLNDMLADDDVRYILDNADARAAVVGPSFADTLAAVAPDLPALDTVVTVGEADPETAPAGGGSGLAEQATTVAFPELLSRHDGAVPETDPGPDQLAAVFHTGGTTGEPKGVRHTQRTLALNAQAHALELDIRPDERLLLTTPLAHSAGLVLAGALAQGACTTVTQGFAADEALGLIADRGISWTFAVPTMIYRLLDELAAGEYDVSSLETLVYGAAPMKPERLQEGLARLGDVFIQLYGQYETPDLITVLGRAAHDPDDERRLSSCGRPASMAEVRVVDGDGNDCPPGEAGEILARAAYTMEGYHDLPEVTAETMTDGWVHTGDIGEFDEEGYLYILDREADVIVTGGMNVYSVAVENVVQAHPDVDNVAVIGVPDDEWGEAVLAVVVPDGDLDTDALNGFCRDRLADYQRPKRYETREELPTTPYGKLDKKALREPYWREQRREVS